METYSDLSLRNFSADCGEVPVIRSRAQARSTVTRIDTWLKKLESLSNEELDRSAERAARSEKKTAAWVIGHIAEISKRRLEETFAYKGLVDYVTRRLGFSEGEAGLRVHLGVKAAQFPQLIRARWRG